MLELLNRIRVVLVEPTHPGNIGAVARSMKTMGLSRLVMVKPKKFPHYEATKRAAGAESVLNDAQLVESVQSATSDCTLVLGTSVRDREVSWPTFDPRVSASNMLEHLYNEGGQAESSMAEVAILFGRESSGLTNQEMDLCHSQIRIPANDEYSSLNLASAVQIISYELRMASLLVSDEHLDLIKVAGNSFEQRQQLANKDQQQGHLQHLHDVLEKLSFFKKKPPELLMRKLTRLYNKSELTVEEIQILRGILSSIDSQLNNSEN